MTSPTPSPETSSEETSSGEPSLNPVNPPINPQLGWTVYAEQINGRFAMVGFILLLLLEFFTRQDFFTWLGFPR